MLPFSYTAAFNRDLKKIEKRGLDMEKLKKVIVILVNEQPLDPSYKDHPLRGNWVNHRELHILSDWILIYRYEDDGIVFVRTGYHRDLFKE